MFEKLDQLEQYLTLALSGWYCKKNQSAVCVSYFGNIKFKQCHQDAKRSILSNSSDPVFFRPPRGRRRSLRTVRDDIALLAAIVF